MNHENETIIESTISEATAAVEEAIEAALEDVQDAVEEVVAGTEHADLDTPEPKFAKAVGVGEGHLLYNKEIPYVNLGDSIAFNEVHNGREVERTYVATDVDGTVQFLLATNT